jgi:hypothetical protein
VVVGGVVEEEAEVEAGEGGLRMGLHPTVDGDLAGARDAMCSTA